MTTQTYHFIPMFFFPVDIKAASCCTIWRLGLVFAINVLLHNTLTLLLLYLWSSVGMSWGSGIFQRASCNSLQKTNLRSTTSTTRYTHESCTNTQEGPRLKNIFCILPAACQHQGIWRMCVCVCFDNVGQKCCVCIRVWNRWHAIFNLQR